MALNRSRVHDEMGRYHIALAALWLLLSLFPLGIPVNGYAQDSSGVQSNVVPQVPVNSGEVVTALGELRNAAIRLPIAALLGAALAFRPRRRGTPPRSAPVIQTQIILAIVGALVMLVVGASLARAFGVAGVAGLIRYRAKIDDPKDASVMLGTLAVGLASGVGLYVLAAFGAVFVLIVLWLIESIEPQPYKVFSLKVNSKESEKLQPTIEQLLRRSRAKFELRASSAEEISYQVQLPVETKIDALSHAIARLDAASAVEWKEEKKKDKA